MSWLRPAAVLLCLSYLHDGGNAQTVVLDAASVPVTSGPVTLTASSPGDNGNITLQLANGTTLEPSGVLTGVSPQRADVAGTTVVQLALSFLPPDFAAANCSCYFLNASQVMDLERAAVQGGLANVTESGSLLTQFVTALLASPYTTPTAAARLVNAAGSAAVPGPQASDPSAAPLSAPEPVPAVAPSSELSAPAPAPELPVAAETAAAAAAAATSAYSNWSLSCPVPAGYSAVVPAVLWNVTTLQNGSVSAIGIALAGSGAALARVAVWGVGPAVGPIAGGTNVTIQGEGFSTDMQCAFVEPGNGTLATVPARVLDSSSIQCVMPTWQPTAPSWQGVVDNGGNTQLNVTWPDGCGIVVSYGYYPAPVIVSMYPATLPRYGSFPAWLMLQDGLSSILNTTVAEFDPVVRILGAGVNGSDLVLPANLTTDDSEITFSTPDGGTPLPAGSFVVELSLNGGADFSGGSAGSEQVIAFQGPLVAMETDFVSVASGDLQVNVSMYLIGENASPVTATLSVFQRGAAGTANALLPADLVMDEALYWDVGEYGSPKTVTVSLPTQGKADKLQRQALVVNVSSATDADVDAGFAATVISEALQDELAVTFEAGVNQVAYPGQPVRIPINVTAGTVPVPAAVDYTVTLLTSVEAPILPMLNGSLVRTLAWDPVHGGNAAITLPINWTEVPLWAEYRLAVQLQPVSNAVVTDASNGVQQVAVHIFGVDQGTCPPGTYLKPRPGESPTPSPPPPPGSQGSPTPTPARDARLSAIRLMAGDAGTPVTLSTAFQPTVTSYGAVVAHNTSDVTLCLQPMQPSARLSVYDSTLALMPELGQTITATVPMNGSSSASAAAQAAAGRRRQRRLLLRQSSSQGTSWWKRRRLLALVNASSGGAAAAECSGPEWTLALSAGQNDFSVFVRSASAAAEGHSSLLSFSQQQAALVAVDNSSALYNLSIVQLSDPGHANLSALLSTADANATVVCGPSGNAAELIDSMQAAGDTVAPGSALQPASAPGSDARAASPAAVRRPTRSAHTSNSPAPAPDDSGVAAAANLPCAPDQLMYINASASTTWISLQAVLAFPTVQGIRVEVNGQVLSQGGDVTADQVTDTTSVQPQRQDPGFLPSAIIVGLDPGVPLEVPIVVTAEDGVTSQRYYVVVTRAVAAATTAGSALGSLEELWAAALAPGGDIGLLGDLGPSVPGPAGGFAAAPSSGPGSAVLSGLAPSSEQVMLEDAQIENPETAVSPAAGPSSDDIQPVLMPLPGTSADLPYSTDAEDASQIPAGWPTPPALQPACGACIAGWASTTANASYCTLCGPGTYAAYLRSPECAPCPTGTYASSWGSSHCRSCVLGTYGPAEGGSLCLMCPTNYTNSADGSAACTEPIQPGTNLTEVYAVIVSFGVYFNGTTLDEIAAMVGVQASPYQILSNLVRADTATAFNISVGDVQVTGITQLSRRVLFVNISASIPVDVSPGASEGDVRAAVNVKSLSADGPINLLAQNPDKFFGRTTKALGVNAEGDNNVQRVTSAPLVRGDPALRWPAILGIVLGGLLMLSLCGGIFARKRTRRIYGAVVGALSGSGRGRSNAPQAPMVALSPIRHRATDRILHQTEYSDSAAADVSDAS